MRWMCAALVAAASVGAASGQILWTGVAAGTTWTWHAPTAPDTDFLHSSDVAPSIFVAFTVNKDTLFRLRVADLPYVPVIDGVAWPGKLRGYTAGIDYTFPGIFGDSVLSAGLGGYNLRLQAQQPPPGVEQTKFGWYFGLGEWFQLTQRSRVTVELTMDRASMIDNPVVIAANVGLAFSF